MNLLIVDDEPDAIQTIIKHLCWERLKFDTVHTAFNKAQAIEQIQQHKIDILLSDIEMPLGSGLELLEWVKGETEDIGCIFMTCHAEFNYIQKAMQLGSLDYILKPIDFEKLEKVLLKARLKITENRHLKMINSYWMGRRKDVIKQFWKDLFVGDIQPNQVNIRQYCQLKHIDIPLDSWYLPILICVRQWPENITRDDQRLFFYALRNIADELFDISGMVREVLPFSDEMVLIILRPQTEIVETESEGVIQERCSLVIDAAQKYFQVISYCYIGGSGYLYGIPEQLEQLQMMNYNNVILSEPVLFLNRCKKYLFHYGNQGQPIWLELWLDLLKEKKYTSLRENIEQVMAQAMEQELMNRKYLEDALIGFQYLLFEFSNRHHIFLDCLFGDDTAKNYAAKAEVSCESFLRWVALAIGRLEAYEKEDSEMITPVEKAKRYIENRLSEELSMDEIAAYVHLSADYFNRIFKQKVGVVLSKYVIQKKIEKAKWLIHHTQMTLGDIAAMVGYYNYSSFNRIFQREVGMSPQEYKQKCKLTN